MTSPFLELAQAAATSRGLGPLRAKQLETLSHLAEGKSCFAALPTGYGKSLCYQLPAVAWGWRTMVISPLVSLIEDQAHSARELGISAVAWHAGIPRRERQPLMARTRAGDWQVCFLSPERFLLWLQQGRAREIAPRLVVLDEMHCLSEWGEFRAGYRELASALGEFLRGGGIPLLGLSASFPLSNSRMWMERLVGPHALVEAPLGRDNLTLRVLPLERGEERWLRLLEALRDLREPDTALVYCFSRDETDHVARWLRSAGFAAVPFHAGIPAEERAERIRSFRAGRLRVVCATSAFGMGIDYPHVTRVVHFSMPRDLESYWQEVGRAGRAGQPAIATAFWRRSEIIRARILDAGSRERFFALWAAWAGARCRKVVVAERLGLTQNSCGICDRCEAPNSFDSRGAWWFSPEARLEEWINQWRKDVKESPERFLFSSRERSE